MIFAACLAIALAYGWYWHARSVELRAVVERSLNLFAKQVSQQNMRTKVSYDGVTSSGFPLPRAKVKGLTIASDDLIRQLVLKFDPIVVRAEMEDYSQLSADTPVRAVLEVKRGDLLESYDLRLSHSPKLLIALTARGEKMHDKALPKRFAVVFPDQITLSFQINELQRDILFNTAMMQLPVWQPVRYDTGASLSFFYEILAEAASRAQ